MKFITLFESTNKDENIKFNNIIRKINVPYIRVETTEQKCKLKVKDNDKILSFTIEEFNTLTNNQVEDLLGYKIISMKEAEDIIFSYSTYFFKRLNVGELKPGMIVSEDVVSKTNNPLFRTSMRDGYGWNTSWKITSLILKKTSVYAETETLETFKEGETCYITTGGKVPDEFNTIIMIENVEEKDGLIIIKKIPDSPSFIRQIGSDVKEGDIILKKDTVINPYNLGLLMSANVKEIQVYDLPSVSLFSTGNELVSYDKYRGEGVVDINTPIISNRISSLCNIDNTTILKDNLDDIVSALKDVKSRIIIISGGASVGEHDFTKSALLELGYKIHFCKVNMMPGKPFTFATLDTYYEKIVFSLPGNPVATSVLTELFIVPFIKKISGVENYKNKIIKAFIDFDVSINTTDPRPDYQRVMLTKKEGEITALSTGKQTSSTIKSMCEADGIICVDRKINKGELVDVILINNSNDFNCMSETQTGKIKIGILTASDRASKGIYEDISGKNIKEYLDSEYGVGNYDFIYKVLPDEKEHIKNMLLDMVISGCCLIVTTGGSGPSIRDVTTLATKDIIDKELPGFGEEMRRTSLKYVPTAILSGQTAGIKYWNNKGTLIINLPGSPKSIKECLDAVFPAIPYCIELMGWKWVETKNGWRPKK